MASVFEKAEIITGSGYPKIKNLPDNCLIVASAKKGSEYRIVAVLLNEEDLYNGDDIDFAQREAVIFIKTPKKLIVKSVSKGKKYHDGGVMARAKDTEVCLRQDGRVFFETGQADKVFTFV